MKATVRDSQTLDLIHPEDLEIYLASREWSNLRAFGPYGAIYNRTKGTRKYELLVPVTKDIDDFPQRISDILRTLEVVEERSQIEILSDLTTTRSDVVRIRRGEAVDGTLSLEDGAHLINSAYDMVMAAACTAVAPRLYHQGKRPGQASEYIQKARLGQSERGSYVITVISPLPHRIEQQSLFGMQDPFERQVTRFLSEGLHAIVEASEYALRKASTDHFRETITVGVSANLLDAVLGLMGSNRHAVGVNFAWSPELPAVDVPVDTITFDPDFAPVIQEASKFLKQQEPSPPVDLLGVVVALRRPEGVDQGRATLLSFIDSRPRHVNLELTQEFYDVAILAHRERRPVTCRGELMRLGRVIVLAKITRFDLAPEEGDAEEPPALFPSET